MHKMIYKLIYINEYKRACRKRTVGKKWRQWQLSSLMALNMFSLNML